MANRKISQLPEATIVADNDIIPVVDSSEAVTKKVQVSILLANQLTADERAKLQGIQAGATANQTDAHLKSRGNHTGTQTASTISDFDTEVSNNPSVTANTAKVSADGSVTTHSDVTSAGSGQIITTTERNKLAGIASGATSNQTDANLQNRANHTGTQTASTISDFDTEVSNNPSVNGSVTTHSDVSNAGSGQIITSTERTKLGGIATGATANQTDAHLKNRANHTGTQTLSTISDAGSSASLNVASSGNASASQVVKGNDSRLTDARHPILP
jgi:hypothetical protein